MGRCVHCHAVRRREVHVCREADLVLSSDAVVLHSESMAMPRRVASLASPRMAVRCQPDCWRCPSINVTYSELQATRRRQRITYIFKAMGWCIEDVERVFNKIY